MPFTLSVARSSFSATAISLAPGVLLSGLVAVLSYGAAPYVAPYAPIPAIVLALIIGMAFNLVAARPSMQAGMTFCIKTVLRWSVALLGLRVALGDVAALGASTAIIVIASMIVTVIAGFVFARVARRDAGFGALIGVGTAVCGASATLAVSTVVPDYKSKQADIVFVVVALNALATAAMLIYPGLCALLGFDAQVSGIMLGATIHDVAQVAGAGYGLSPEAGNAAVIVKLFRVFLLLPAVVAVGFYFSRRGAHHGEARVPVPAFAIVFFVLCLLNSAVQPFPELTHVYAPLRSLLIDLSSWGLLIAISALGLGTSVRSLVGMGWRHVASLVGTTLVILALVTGGLLLVG